MSSEIKIKLDRGALIKSADGTVTLGGKAGCITWAFVVFSGLAMLGAGAVTVAIIPRLFDSNDPIGWETVVEGLAINLFLGFATFYLFNNAKRGKVTINPVTKMIEIGKREISFAEVETVISKSTQVPLADGAVAITFIVVLRTAEQVSIGSISGESKKIDERVTQILTILGDTITK